MRSRMLVRAVAFAALLGAVAPVRSFAQPAEQKAVQDAVEAFLLHLGDGEFDKVAADMAAKAIIVIVRQRDGKFANTYETGDAWVASLKRNTNFSKFREPITNVKVTVDSDALAYLRADFQVVRDGKTLSHGVDQFTLVREDGHWKVAAVAYTSIPGM
jgi:SnoaL-like protein